MTALALVLLFSPQVAAQSLIDAQSVVRQREQLELGQRLRSMRRPPPLLGPASVAPPNRAAIPFSFSQRCWWVDGIRLTGNRLIAQADITQAIAPHLSACIDTDQINRLLAAITALYVDKGYIASRPQLALPPADREPLRLDITEGFVESIEVSDQSLPLSLRSAFNGMLGQPLQLRNLERGLEQLNRLQAFDLTADVEPGDAIGASRIVIRPLSRPSRWSLNANFNNAGKPDTGRHQAQLTVSLDSPLHLNDFIYLSAGQTFAHDPALSRILGVYYAIPFEAWSFNLSANGSEYQMPVVGLAGSRLSHGSNTALGMGLERSLWRDQQRLLSATVRIDRKRTDAWIGEQLLEPQSPRLLNAEAGLNLLWTQQGIWTAYLGVSRGLSDWRSDAQHRDVIRKSGGNPSALPDSPRGQFTKWRMSLGYLTQRPWAGQQWQWRSQLAAQYSRDPLPPAEQQVLTEQYAVRGLQDLSLAASTAASWNNTLILKHGLGAGWSLEPQLGLDVGWRRLDPLQRAIRDPFASVARMAGASAGIALVNRHTRLNLGYQHALYLPGAPRPPGFWRLELALKL
ncbi:MAG: ShlB/FhaC/HecB family hemolysin secretion/activation protein [Janthinobacterium lividum]